MNLKTKTVCILDNGMFVSMAKTIAPHFKRTLYFCPWVSSFPTINLLQIGQGLEGVERVDYLWDIVDEVDLFVCLDVNMGDIQVQLRKMGKAVWGSGKGEELELFRMDAKEFQKQVGLPTQPVRLITGVTKLREYLKEHDDLWIKISQTRGDGESWHHINYRLSEPKLDTIDTQLGPVADVYEFIVEDSIPTLTEVGYDGFCIDGEFPQKNAVIGYELKDCGYIGTTMPYADLPKEVQMVNAKLAPLFKGYGYRGFYSSEIRIGKDGKAYLIDSTSRYACPPGELYQMWWKNLPEVLWAGAHGEIVEVEPIAKYGFEFVIYSEWAAKNWQAIYMPKEVEPFVKLFNHTRVKGADYIVPTDSGLVQIGGVIGFGNTIKEAVEQATAHAKEVEGYEVTIKTDSVPKLMEILRESKKNGINFGSSPIPDL